MKKKNELKERTDTVINATCEALQIIYDNLNPGQKKQIIKEPAVKELFDRYNVTY